METRQLLEWSIDSLQFIVPEISLLAGIVLIVFAGLFQKEWSRWLGIITSVSFLVLLGWSWPGQSIRLFQGMLVVADITMFMKILFGVALLLTFAMTRPPSSSRKAEFDLLLLGLVLGASLTIMAANFLMLVLALEVTAICSFLLAGFRFNRHGAEAALKYFLMGVSFTGVIVYGISLLYGVTGTIDFSSEDFSNKLLSQDGWMAGVGALLIVSGILFKMAAAPFHLWAPDVYEGAPTPVVAIFSVVPKFAGLVVLIRLILIFNLFGQSLIDWPSVVAVFASISILIGSLAALRQTHLRRLLSYASVAQAGFLLLGVAAFSDTGLQTLLFYSVTYLLGNYAVFFVLNDLEQKLGIEHLSDLRLSVPGLRSAAIPLTLAFVSLTGLPPLAGFTGKLLLFTSLLDTYAMDHAPAVMILFISGLVATVISFYYYFRIPWMVFIRHESPEAARLAARPIAPNLFAWLLVLTLLFLFLQPSLLMGWLNRLNFAF